jgi:hypothetical protein
MRGVPARPKLERVEPTITVHSELQHADNYLSGRVVAEFGMARTFSGWLVAAHDAPVRGVDPARGRHQRKEMQ